MWFPVISECGSRLATLDLTYKKLISENLQYVLARKSGTSPGFELVEKLEAHREGLQHYAFSIFIFNSSGELLIQKRALHKYHSPGLWTNTCCSHPLSQDFAEIKRAAKERLLEEVGLACPIDYSFKFEYFAQCGHLIENEIDFVFTGLSDDLPLLNESEVVDYRYTTLETLREDIGNSPEKYTEWLKIIVRDHYHHLLNAVKK